MTYINTSLLEMCIRIIYKQTSVRRTIQKLKIAPLPKQHTIRIHGRVVNLQI